MSVQIARATLDRTGGVTRRLGGYRELAVPDDLRMFVDAIWVYSRPEGTPPIPGPGHRILPEAGVSLCFRCHRDSRGAVDDASINLIGPVGNARFFAPTPGLHLEAVRLKPEWSRALLAVDPREQVDTDDPLETGEGSRWRHLLDLLAGTVSSAEALSVLLTEFRRSGDALRHCREAMIVHAALERIRASRDARIPVSSLAQDAGTSSRHLRRSINAATGFGPKVLQRIVRLNRVFEVADRTDRPDWSRLAVDFGFYDQSHLIQETRSLAGVPPRELHAERRAQQADRDPLGS